jgi:hypothetical protein
MRTFRCTCGARVFFDNTTCLTCGRELGFVPGSGEMSALEPIDDGKYRALSGVFRKCQNYVALGVCNWMIPEGDSDELCRACRLNNVIPDLSDPKNRELWAEVEKAKRRLVYSLDRLGLPLTPKSEDPANGLAFDIKADEGTTRVLTGHAEGLITLNLGEADPVLREQMRTQMNERYRTLLGHFRHEVGHYYWEVLVRDTPALASFRDTFGDERADYAEALERHYKKGPDPGFTESFISAYAASHPWEDWAETFAHFLHLTDTLDTARHFGFANETPSRAEVPGGFDRLFDEWTELTIALNALNRSMGLPDAYPFAISPRVKQKLALVQKIVSGARQGRASSVETNGGLGAEHQEREALDEEQLDSLSVVAPVADGRILADREPEVAAAKRDQ